MDLELRENESHYQQKGIEAHDAGWDAYMTGVIFAQIGKYIEIGNIFKQRAGDCYEKYKKKSKKARFEAFEDYEIEINPNSKRHFTSVQNQRLSLGDLSFFTNRVVMSIEVPRFFHFGDSKTTKQELEFDTRLNENTLWIKTTENVPVDEIAKIFS